VFELLRLNGIASGDPDLAAFRIGASYRWDNIERIARA
jgi:hypothetical protein